MVLSPKRVVSPSFGTRLFGETVGLLSAVSFAVHPLSAYYSLRFLSEPLFTLAFTAVIAAWIAAVTTRRLMAYLAVGALIAVAALVKPVALTSPFANTRSLTR